MGGRRSSVQAPVSGGDDDLRRRRNYAVSTVRGVIHKGTVLLPISRPDSVSDHLQLWARARTSHPRQHQLSDVLCG